MTPDSTKIRITDSNLELIKEFLDEIVIYPKSKLRKWAEITNQTPAVKLGYIGQHLASLITGIPGTSTGARGDDLVDGSEVKSCNKIDQTDKCRVCDNRVMRFQDVCPVCGSDQIERKDDSKWLFTIRDEHELNQYLEMERVVLLIMDYPGFEDGDFNDIRINCYEIYPKDQRMSVFCDLVKNHYYNIYRPKADAGAKTNPMNLHPFGYQFYKCNPVLIFSCIIKNVDTSPEIIIDKDSYVDPSSTRDDKLKSPAMPSRLLRTAEWEILLDTSDYDTQLLPCMTRNITRNEFKDLTNSEKARVLPWIEEPLRNLLPLREIISSRQLDHYQRH